MNLLLLGGTSDARRMAASLHKQGVRLIYSVAGLVRMPDLPCKVISGGFSQFAGLERYIREYDIGAILDLTHPYAQRMSNTAVAAAKQMQIPCWRFAREAWQQTEADQWAFFNDWSELLPALKHKKKVLLTAGQVEEVFLHKLLTSDPTRTIVLRTAAPPAYPMPDRVIWIKAIGPFNVAEERQLFEQYSVDALVSKNSGGNAIIAKIHAARELNTPVFMLARPHKQPADKQFLTAPECSEFVTTQCLQRSLTLNTP